MQWSDEVVDISLKPEQEQFILTQINSGRYLNVDEAISDAIRLLENREQRIQELQHEIAIGTEQIAKGQVTDGELVFARLQEKIDRIAESGG
jgi:antitoxin ParD1/3/4